MSARRRRALASAVGALVVAILCAALSSNVDGARRVVLLVLTVAWLAIAATCVANALRTAPPAETVERGPADAEVRSDPG